MNIFFLDKDPVLAGEMQCDKHIPKMCVETVQMLVSACRRHNWSEDHLPLTLKGTVHKGGYVNHPSTVWAGDNINNFAWLMEHGFALTKEFKKRFGKTHACHKQLRVIRNWCKSSLEWGPVDKHDPTYLSNVPLCIGEKLQWYYEQEDAPLEHAVNMYRQFYRMDKSDFALWEKGTDTPDWWCEYDEIPYP
mgnify:CR=1 FL=1